MTREHMRKILGRWGHTTEMCRRKELEIREYEGLIEGIELQAQKITGMPHGGGLSDPTAQMALRIEGYRQRICELTEDIAELLRQQRLIDEIISQTSPQAQKIIELKYKRHYSWIKVARLTHYSERRVRGIESDAVDELSNIAVSCR